MALSSVYQVCFVTLETLLNMKRVGNNLSVLLDIEPMGLNKKKKFFFFLVFQIVFWLRVYVHKIEWLQLEYKKNTINKQNEDDDNNNKKTDNAYSEAAGRESETWATVAVDL